MLPKSAASVRKGLSSPFVLYHPFRRVPSCLQKSPQVPQFIARRRHELPHRNSPRRAWRPKHRRSVGTTFRTGQSPGACSLQDHQKRQPRETCRMARRIARAVAAVLPCPRRFLARRTGSSTGSPAGCTAPWSITPHNHGADNRIWSEALHEPRDLYVYLPPGFDPSGNTRSCSGCTASPRTSSRSCDDVVGPLDEAIHCGKLPPVIVVAPDGSFKGEPCYF